ncbi:MAG: LPS export ABC transporter ATP-binding protein, partial [Myxococcota bacterium]
DLPAPFGPSKPTSFNMVAGLLPPDAGSVFLGDDELRSEPLHERARRGLGYLPQDQTIFRGLTVTENITAVLEARGVSSRDARARAQEVLERYNLTHVSQSRGSELSGGERRRLEMARTQLHNPKVVLLDEPFAGVDPIAVSEINGFIRTMRDQGIGVLVTDHNVRETLKICDRAYIISSGQILLGGTPEVIVADKRARESYLGQDFTL